MIDDSLTTIPLSSIIEIIPINLNVKIFDAEDFIANLTLHLPPKNVQYIRRYGLYASRTRGIWISMPEVVARAPHGWKNEHLDNLDTKSKTEKEDIDMSVSEKERFI